MAHYVVFGKIEEEHNRQMEIALRILNESKVTLKWK